MEYSFIREGDTTSHGGKVLACDSANMVDGKPLALLGDMVSCPRCRGVYPIVSVKPLDVTFDGRPVASEGDKTACGASLIASDATATASPTLGHGGSVGNGKHVVPHASTLSQNSKHRGRFQVLDDETDEPIVNHPYAITSSTGQTVTGRTDANGFTDWLEDNLASSITFSHPGTTSNA
jgi:uncharacterized Zn-binding protein involved in type VI secretion